MAGLVSLPRPTLGADSDSCVALRLHRILRSNEPGVCICISMLDVGKQGISSRPLEVLYCSG